jgi:hypothetical protein
MTRSAASSAKSSSLPFQRVSKGPQVGAPPSLEQVPVDRLNVDDSYQRATDSPGSRAIIVRMIKQWDWSLCQPLVVARRSDGTLWILDGQHRHAGAVERGDISFLPCVILSTLDREGEARTFVKLNTEQQKLNQAEIFHGMLAAGDPDAKQVQQLLDDAGWRVVRSSGTDNWKPGDLQCAPMLVKALKLKGAGPVQFALTSLRAAYADLAVRQSATLLKALFDVFEMIGDAGVSVNALVKAISSISPEAWPVRGVALQERHPNLSATNAIARAMMREAKPTVAASTSATTRAKPAPIAARTAPPAPPKSVASTKAPAPDGPVFGAAGKGWCSQCEQLVSRDKAAACRSAFCRMQGAAAA